MAGFSDFAKGLTPWGAGKESEKYEKKAPTFEQSEGATGLISDLKGQIAGQPDYAQLLSRYNVGADPLSTGAQTDLQDLIGQGYGGTGYEEYLKRFTPSENEFGTAAKEGYRGLIGQDYGTENYDQIEQDYLDSILGKFKESRSEGFEPIRERLIGENLYESGPGFGQEREYAGETAEGVGDISKQYAYEGIERKINERNYQDALKRGDYDTMYKLALSEQEQEIRPKLQATELANAEKQYYDALKRGDMETAFNMGQILRQNKVSAVEGATGAETRGLEGGLQLLQQLLGRDIAEFQGGIEGFKAKPKSKKEQGYDLLSGVGLLGG